jgi:hypothetical protein
MNDSRLAHFRQKASALAKYDSHRLARDSEAATAEGQDLGDILFEDRMSAADALVHNGAPQLVIRLSGARVKDGLLDGEIAQEIVSEVRKTVSLAAPREKRRYVDFAISGVGSGSLVLFLQPINIEPVLNGGLQGQAPTTVSRSVSSFLSVLQLLESNADADRIANLLDKRAALSKSFRALMESLARYEVNLNSRWFSREVAPLKANVTKQGRDYGVSLFRERPYSDVSNVVGAITGLNSQVEGWEGIVSVARSVSSNPVNIRIPMGTRFPFMGVNIGDIIELSVAETGRRDGLGFRIGQSVTVAQQFALRP